MKLRYFIPAFIALVGAMMVSCSDEDTVTLLDEIQVSRSYVPINLDGGEATIDLKAQADWSFEEADIPEWLTISPKNGGAGETKVTFSAPAADNGRNADLHMEGEITNYQLSPQAVGEDAYASQTRLTITVKVKYVNNKNQALSKDLSFSAYRDFSSSELLVDVQDELCNQICKDLSDLIFNATLGDW